MAIRLQRPTHSTIEITGLDGVRRPIAATALPLRGQHGKLIGAIAHLLVERERVKVTFWGTRGSLASAGPETVRYGGNTACVEVSGRRRHRSRPRCRHRHPATRRPPRRDAAHRCPADPSAHGSHPGSRLLRPALPARLDVHIWGPPALSGDLRSRLARYLSPPLFPVRVRDLHTTTFHDAPFSPVAIGGLTVVADMVIHPGPTLGYRIEADRTLVYLPDHEPAIGARHFPEAPEWTSGYGLAVGVDVLIHDAQYTNDGIPDRKGWGHTSIEQAVAFATLCGAGLLVPFHHDPGHDDIQLDGIDHRRDRRGLADDRAWTGGPRAGRLAPRARGHVPSATSAVGDLLDPASVDRLELERRVLDVEVPGEAAAQTRPGRPAGRPPPRARHAPTRRSSRR